MPPLPSPGKVLRCTLKFDLNTARSPGSRFYINYTGPDADVADCTAIAGEMGTAWASQFSPMQPAFYSLVESIVEDLSSSSGAVGNNTASHPGTGSGTPGDASQSACVEFTIGRRYRGGKPKIFLPIGFTSDFFSGNEWNASFVAAVNSAWTTFFSDVLGTAGLAITLVEHVNVSYYEGFSSVQNPVTKRWRNIPTPRAVPVVDAVTSHNLARKIGSQRRRLRI